MWIKTPQRVKNINQNTNNFWNKEKLQKIRE